MGYVEAVLFTPSSVRRSLHPRGPSGHTGDVAIDPDLIRALHLHAEDRRGAAMDHAAAHHVFQTSTIAAVLEGRYDGEMTIGEILAHGDLGLGTLHALDGELIIVDGDALVARADGRVSPVPDHATTPFAVVTPFAPGAPVALADLAHGELLSALDDHAPAPVSAIRIDGRFRGLHLRSVPRQSPPYPSLVEVTAGQVEWQVSDVDATVLGFRFPRDAAGIEAPGWHLHAITHDRATGGHVLSADLASGVALFDATDEMHVELPPGVNLEAGTASVRADIDRAEGQHRP